jgi:hypothetical protein
MTDNEMRIAIAEKCGPWKNICWPHDLKNESGMSNSSWEGPHVGYVSKPITYKICKKCGKEFGRLVLPSFPDIPNYPNDLNAMHEAEKTLVPDKFGQYLDRLREITQSENRYEVENRFELVHATARQRCEAFIKTVCPEKWKGNE